MSVPEAALERIWAAGTNGADEGLAIAREFLLAVRARVQGVVLSSASGSADELAQLLGSLPE
jgi:hypothetical protein